MNDLNENVAAQMDIIANERDKWISKNKYYYDNLIDFLKFNVPENSSIIEIGCGTGNLLKNLNPARAVGIDISPEMVRIAKINNPEYDFYVMNAEDILTDEKFDFIIISDTIGYFKDVQKVFNGIHNLCKPETRIIITYVNFLWLPVINMAEFLKLEMPHHRNNWLDIKDFSNLLQLCNFDVIKSGRKFIMPFYIPLISSFFNKFISNLPLINKLCLNGFIIARSLTQKEELNKVSIVIPARNEKGNIETILKRIPEIGDQTEIIFVEGNSTDNTLDEIIRVCKEYTGRFKVKYAVQDGKGKADAVRKGFEMAEGDIYMILDADMTVPPEDLEKFYSVISSGKGEFLNGSRLVYPLEEDAMRTLNILGNKFFSLMFTWILNQRIKDTLCGTKVISAVNYEKLKIAKKYFGDFDPFGDFDLIFGAAKLNLKFAEIPIRYKARVYGETNISRFRHGWMLLKMIFFAMRKIKFR